MSDNTDLTSLWTGKGIDKERSGGCFYDDGLKFACKRCGRCCGSAPGFVYLSRRDLLTLCKGLDMSVRSFVAKYCRFTSYYEGQSVLALKEKSNYDCILFDKGCSAYQFRPLQCSTYPFWTWMIEDKESWDIVAESCGGMNQGKLYPKDFIQKQSAIYEQNKPISKEEVGELVAAEKEDK